MRTTVLKLPCTDTFRIATSITKTRMILVGMSEIDHSLDDGTEDSVRLGCFRNQMIITNGIKKRR